MKKTILFWPFVCSALFLLTLAVTRTLSCQESGQSLDWSRCANLPFTPLTLAGSGLAALVFTLLLTLVKRREWVASGLLLAVILLDPRSLGPVSRSLFGLIRALGICGLGAIWYPR